MEMNRRNALKKIGAGSLLATLAPLSFLAAESKKESSSRRMPVVHENGGPAVMSWEEYADPELRYMGWLIHRHPPSNSSDFWMTNKGSLSRTITYPDEETLTKVLIHTDYCSDWVRKTLNRKGLPEKYSGWVDYRASPISNLILLSRLDGSPFTVIDTARTIEYRLAG